jgi:XTP/dITP diphosphohydrolase
MEKLVFATNNAHKLDEVKKILANQFEILSLKEISCFDEIPETSDTLEGNAEQKANWVLEKYGYDCFADDTGLEVEALDGAPGVYSARYAGENCSYQDNCLKLLKETEGKENRKAKFRTVICLKLNGQTHFFDGAIDGIIIDHQRGTNGFGYDPVFEAEGTGKTLAEMDDAEKNSMSHRYRATAKLAKFLSK